jgi:hypothetical protein
MPTELIPFGNTQASGNETLGGAKPLAMNVFVDGTGTVRRRPGIATYATAPATSLDALGIIGLHATVGGRLFAVGATGSGARLARPIYAVSGGGSAEVGRLPGTRRSIMAETELNAIFAGGAELIRTDLAGLTSADLSADAPLSHHVIGNSLRLLADDYLSSASLIRYSGIASGNTDYSGHEDWVIGVDDSGAFTAEARNDPVVALHENTNEVFAFGATTLQIFTPDPTTVYAPAGAREFGCSAPYSVIKFDASFAWLDEKRRFVISDGRSAEVISDAIQSDIDSIGTASDCIGYRVLDGPLDALVWTFPSDGRSFVFQKGSGWGQWAARVAGNWARFPVNAHVLRADTDENVVGTTDGLVCELSLAAEDDLGTAIHAFVQSGFLDRKSSRLKRVLHLRVTLQRGEPSGANDPIAWIRWRDRPGAWQQNIPIPPPTSGSQEVVVDFHQLGTYRSREWCFEWSGTENLRLVKVEEEYEELNV